MPFKCSVPSHYYPTSSWQLVYVRQVDVDIVVLTVVAPEYTAARKAFRARGRSKTSDGTVWYRGAIRSRILRREYSIALVCIGQAGNPSAAVACQKAISTFHPKAMFIVGIGGGYRAKTKIGEVIFSDRVVAYESQAVVGPRGNISQEARFDTERSPYTIMQDLTAWLADDHRETRMRKRFVQIGGTVPKAKKGQAKKYRKYLSPPLSARLGTLASGEKLVKNPDFFTALRKVHGKIEVVEMEAVGLTEACRTANVPWLVTRGISDFGDSFKNDHFHEYASTAATVALADFVGNALELGPATPALKTKPYLTSIRQQLAKTATVTIPRTALTAGNSPVQLGSALDGFVPGDGESYLLSGPSGRGKTTALRLTLLIEMRDSPAVFMGMCTRWAADGLR